MSDYRCSCCGYAAYHLDAAGVCDYCRHAVAAGVAPLTRRGQS